MSLVGVPRGSSASLRRPVGGTVVWRRQLERLLGLGKLRRVSVQVPPTEAEEHVGAGGVTEVLESADGAAVGRFDGALAGRPVTGPKRSRCPPAAWARFVAYDTDRDRGPPRGRPPVPVSPRTSRIRRSSGCPRRW
ncbi:Scr1 family TA system antitoxin-like transcriptional regulator [Streptomyces sp. NPDC017966]|uniref:Scr1 family TA system antitoxin-like transcriptional regulator n=1 Tax=unclassified Streptomyces TaxID=2593676 RepID=UPI0035AF6156